MEIELIINRGGYIQAPILIDDIKLELELRGYPGTLTFTVWKDEALNILEGDPVRLAIDGEVIFYGFIFTKTRSELNKIEITAYDQLRYLKNKDTYTYENKTATEVINMIINDFNLNAGYIEDTKYKIASRVEDDTSLFDIIQNALDITIINTGKYYILYDNAGEITLKSIDNMITDYYLDEETAEKYDYTSSIDEETYNQIVLREEDDDTGITKVYMTKDSTTINSWGILQYTDTVEDGEDGITKAETLLSLYNQKTRSITIKNAIGRVDIRPGCMIYIKLDIGDVILDSLMMVYKCTHTINSDNHFMELELIGGEFTSA